MSLRTSAKSKFARLRPPEKMGTLICGAKGPCALARIKQVREIRAGTAEHPGQRNARKERRAGRTDVRIAGTKPMLGRLNVRPMRQQLGGRTRCDLLHQQHVLAGVSGQIATDIAHANQQAQGIARLAKLAVNALQVSLGLFGQATRLLVVECGGNA